jgi:hypothetical protein
VIKHVSIPHISIILDKIISRSHIIIIIIITYEERKRTELKFCDVIGEVTETSNTYL